MMMTRRYFVSAAALGAGAGYLLAPSGAKKNYAIGSGIATGLFGFFGLLGVVGYRYLVDGRK